jgi:hypothetical protein
MPTLRLNVDIKQKGTIFSASATQAAAARMVVGINDDLAQEAYTRIQQRLGEVLRHPTGFYQSRIVVERRQTYRGVSDSGVIYGGWLEGVSSRNRTTRFKGYSTFRLVKQSMQKDKAKLAQPTINAFIGEMNK